MNQNQNWNCCSNKCSDPHSHVRVLPIGGGGNLILCYDCFIVEMEWRQHMNNLLGVTARWPIPKWEDLKVYEGA